MERIAPVPQRRRDVVRVSDEAVEHLRAGHPWVYRDAIERKSEFALGDVVDVVDVGGSFLGRGLFDSSGAIAVRLLVGPAGRTIPLDARFLRERVAQANHWRETWISSATTAYRVIHAEGDGLSGVTCDRYGDFLVAQLYTAAWEKSEPLFLDALEQVCRPAGIYLQRRYRPSDPGQKRAGAEHVRGQVAPLEVEVLEGGLRFGVDVTAPLSPGLFPDLRDGRLLVATRASGRRVLNIFSFTGAFTVHAFAGGASEVTAIDVAERAHTRARANLQRNGFADRRCELLVGDAIATLSRLASRGRRFDMVIIDPPTFAAGKGKPFTVLRDYAELIAAAVKVLDTGGMLAVSANTHRMTQDEFDRACANGGSMAGVVLRIVERRGLPADFPILAMLTETNYLKFAILSKL